jgi:hypothetical protein
MGTKLFVRSPHRDAILELLATAPAEGVPTAVIMQIDGVGSRNNADQLLSRMVRAGEITRRGIGRYGPPRRPPDVAQPITPAPITPAPPPPRSAPIPAAPGRQREAALRDHFRHRSKLDTFRQALFEDEDSELFRRQVGEDRSNPPAATADRTDVHEFVGRIGCLYGRHRLCPPFLLRDFAAAWLADGIAPPHCLAVVDRHLQAHAASCRSGCGDRLLPYLDKLVRFEWNRAQHPQRRRPEPRPRNSIDDYTTRSRAPRMIDDRAGITAEADWEGDY